MTTTDTLSVVDSAAWNTGRLYAKDGQPIVAHIREDRTVIFKDFARSISGKLDIPLHCTIVAGAVFESCDWCDEGPMAELCEECKGTGLVKMPRNYLRTFVMKLYDSNRFDWTDRDAASIRFADYERLTERLTK